LVTTFIIRFCEDKIRKAKDFSFFIFFVNFYCFCICIFTIILVKFLFYVKNQCLLSFPVPIVCLYGGRKGEWGLFVQASLDKVTGVFAVITIEQDVNILLLL